MRIAITADPSIPVPPDFYGGIERVVDLLVRGLVRRNHEVSLFANPESRTPARLYSYGMPPHFGWRARSGELWQVGSRLWQMRNQLDIVHSFGRLAALLPILPCRKLPKIQSYQRNNVPWRSVRTATRLARHSIRFTGCSSSVYRDRAEQGQSAGEWSTIFNGVNLSKYTFQSSTTSDAPLAFLGRIERIKGVHNAIAIARATGRRLNIAGNKVETGPDANYFETEVAPHVDDNQIKYIGPANDQQKNELLGQSAALLMPIEWEEPFGIVMVEAFACGTPVVGFRRGSVPEVIREGINGYICGSLDEATRAVANIDKLSRRAVWEDCVQRFGDDAIVAQYEKLYLEMAAR